MLPVSAVQITTIVGVAVAAIGIYVAVRQRVLQELVDKNKEVKATLAKSTVEDEIDQVVEFLRALEEQRGRFVRIADIHRKFGAWFFSIAFAQHGLDPFLKIDEDKFEDVKSLYRAWARYGRKHKIDEFNSQAAKRWGRQAGQRRARTRILWHHELQKEDSTLFFWRLRFEPAYNQRTILNLLDLVCEDFQVASYVAYELLGPHDILLRAWLSAPDEPSNTEYTESESARTGWEPSRVEHMTDRLREPTSDESNTYFQVEEVYRHWWWIPWRPWADELLPKGESDPHNQKAAERIVNAYNAGYITRIGLWLEPVWWQYRWKRMVRRRRLYGGIKFATVVRAKPGSETPQHSPTHDVVDAVKSAWHVRDRSVYAGKGFRQDGVGEARFLILGRVRGVFFGRLRKRIIDRILRKKISEHYAPPLTYIATGPDTMRETFQDGLAKEAPDPHT